MPVSAGPQPRIATNVRLDQIEGRNRRARPVDPADPASDPAVQLPADS